MAEEKVKISNYLNQQMIFLDQDFKSTDELFEAVAQKAATEGFVTDSFLPKIKQRESTFPTGLQLETRGVAIPHTDADTIKKEFIAVITDKNGVPFKRMDDPDADVSAKVIFVLGLNQPHAQLEMLQTLMATIQDDALLDKVEKASKIDDIFDIL
ncbi:PTS sugar transporter subunit IIA [Loigolactobacillus bifermentans]|nr:PTS sugar transporter subunit IIA [Loigolactobacillus bifermentans]QGG60840.1 PTS sugar transporter subunit IIA [Loigolactobacillus bifermentans]